MGDYEAPGRGPKQGKSTKKREDRPQARGKRGKYKIKGNIMKRIFIVIILSIVSFSYGEDNKIIGKWLLVGSKKASEENYNTGVEYEIWEFTTDGKMNELLTGKISTKYRIKNNDELIIIGKENKETNVKISFKDDIAHIGIYEMIFDYVNGISERYIKIYDISDVKVVLDREKLPVRSACITGNCTNGIGTMIWSNEEKYEGQWKNKNENDQGTYTWPNGDKYVGQFKDGKQGGQGTYTYVDGKKYVGQFKDDHENGQGTLTYPEGAEYQKYVGQFKNDNFGGQGMLIYADGKKYTGQFKEGKREGNGTLITPAGEKYTGQWQDDQMTGKGTFINPFGAKYVGDYVNGIRHGYGTLYKPNGTIEYQGKWVNGIFVGN